MQFTILFLLTVCLSIATADFEAVKATKKYVEKFVQHGEGNPIDLDNHFLTLLDKCLGTTSKALIWKAVFDGEEEVAVKFFTDALSMNQEIAAYQALKAIEKSKDEIEQYGIPKVYYVGKMFGRTVMVMTLFDECLYTRWRAQKKKFNTYTTLQVLLQSVSALRYLRSKRVLHNDIKPQNIFLRGENVFVGDFDMATLNGELGSGCTDLFASSRKWAGQKRNAMDDLESLVFSIWYIEGINSWQPDGFMLSNQTADQNIDFVTEKCEHFANYPATQSACLFICRDEMLSGKSIPAYKEIIDHLKTALSEVKQLTGQKEFEWLSPPLPEPAPSSSHASSSKSKSKMSKMFSFGKKK